MAVDIARLGIEVDTSQVRSATADLARFQGTAQGVGREAQRVGGQMTAFLTAPILGAGAIAVKTAADYETLQVQLEVLLGSAEQAEQVFGRLSEFAATTPFELEGITRANNLLLGFGLNVEETFDLLQTLGDVSAVTGGSLFDMARVFGEARAEGNLLTRDLRQLVNQGVPAIQLLAESLGVAESEIFDMASAGEISFERLIAAFEKATEQGGLFFDGMGQRSNTLTGIFSNLADSVNLSLGSIGNTLIETLDIKGVTRELIADIEAATEWFNNLDASAQRMIITLTGIVAAAGPVIAILGTLSLAIGAISAPVAAVAAAVGVATALIIANWEDVETYFTSGGGAGMWTDLQEIVGTSVQIITDLWEQFGDNIVGFTEGAFSTILQIVETSLSAVNDTVQVWAELYNGEYKKAFTRAEDSWREHVGNMGSILQTGLLALREIDVFGVYKLWEALGLIPSQEELQQQLTERMQRAVEQARRNATPRVDDTLIEPNINLPDFAAQAQRQFEQMDRVSAPIEVPVHPIIPVEEVRPRMMDSLSELLDPRNTPVDLGERLFPPGSVGALQSRIQELQREIQFAFDPETIAGYQEQIRQLQEEIDRLSGKTGNGGFAGLNEAIQSAQRPMEDFLGGAVTEAVFFEEQTRRVRNEFGEWETQTITLKDRLADMFDTLLQELVRTTAQLLVIRPLMDGIFGGLGLPTGGAGAGGNVENVNDALITKEGKIIKGHPNDNWMAFQGDRPPGSGANVNINVINETGSQVEVQERTNPNGGVDIDLMIKRSVQDGFNRGAFDGPMSRNFGVTRKGRR